MTKSIGDRLSMGIRCKKCIEFSVQRRLFLGCFGKQHRTIKLQINWFAHCDYNGRAVTLCATYIVFENDKYRNGKLHQKWMKCAWPIEPWQIAPHEKRGSYFPLCSISERIQRLIRDLCKLFNEMIWMQLRHKRRTTNNLARALVKCSSLLCTRIHFKSSATVTQSSLDWLHHCRVRLYFIFCWHTTGSRKLYQILSFFEIFRFSSISVEDFLVVVVWKSLIVRLKRALIDYRNIEGWC